VDNTTSQPKSSAISITVISTVIGMLVGGISVYKFFESKIEQSVSTRLSIQDVAKDLERLDKDVWEVKGDIKEIEGLYRTLEEEIDKLQ
jgi:CRISPR/Cas system CSM-associated protein Csm2 small subunit